MSTPTIIDARLSDASKKDWLEYEQLLKKNRAELNKLKRDLMQMIGLEKAYQASAVKQTGPGAYMRGVQARADTRANRVAFDGSQPGQMAASQRESMRMVKDQIAAQRNMVQLQAAQNLNLEQTRRSVEQIRDVEKLRSVHQLVLLRQGQALAKQDQESASRAGAILTQIDGRIARMKQEVELARQRKREEQAAQRAMLEQTKHERGRAYTQERLFGDGGAGLMKTQMGLMGNYMLMNQGMQATTGMGNFLVQFDEALHNLQAIVNVTNNDMEGLRSEILSVAESTRYMATEVAEAAVNLGQAGFSAREVQDALGGVALLASATGSDLASSVDIATSVIGVFNKTASDMPEIANTITQGLNDSKLSMDKLTLGMQYAGNTAAQTGVTFEEMVASLGAMSNAGIRSGSTMGTGLRQIIVSLEKPSKKFRTIMQELGITMDDINIRTHGLEGVMTNLKDKGFSASDAIKSFEVRSAAAFTALSGQLPTMKALEESFLGSTAAIQANEIQMQSLANRGRQMLSTLQTVGEQAFGPFAHALADILGVATKVVSSFGALSSAALQLTAAFVAWKVLGRLTGLLTGLMTSTAGVTQATIAQAAAAQASGVAMTTQAAKAGTATAATLAYARAANVARAAFAAMGGWVGIAVTAGVTLAANLYDLIRGYNDLSDAVDQATTRVNNSKGTMETQAARIEQVSAKIGELAQRADHIKEAELDLAVRKVVNEFGSMGLVLPSTVEHVNTLISALEQLRVQLGREYILDIQRAGADTEDLMKIQQKDVDNKRASVTDKLEGRNYWRTADAQVRAAQKNDPVLAKMLDTLDQLQDESIANPDDLALRSRLLFEGDKLKQYGAANFKNPARSVRRLFSRYDELQGDIGDLTGAEQIVARTTRDRSKLRAQEAAGQIEINRPDFVTHLERTAGRSNDYLSSVDQTAPLTAQLQAMQALERQADYEVEALKGSLETMAARAEKLAPGGGDELRNKFGGVIAQIEANIQKSLQARYGSILEEMETGQKSYEAESKRLDDDFARQIEQAKADRNPEQERKLIAARNALAQARARAVKGMIENQLVVSQALGDPEGVADLERSLAGAEGDVAGLQHDRGIDLQKHDEAQQQTYFKSLNQGLTDYRAETARKIAELETARAALEDTDKAGMLQIAEKMQELVVDRAAGEGRLLQEALLYAKDKPALKDESGSLDQQIKDHLTESMAKDQDLGNRVRDAMDSVRDQQVQKLQEGIQAGDRETTVKVQDLEIAFDKLSVDKVEERVAILEEIARLKREQNEANVAALDQVIDLETQNKDEADILSATKAREDTVNQMKLDGEDFNAKKKQVLIEGHQNIIVGIDAAIVEVERLQDLAKTAQELQQLEANKVDLLNQKAGSEVRIGELSNWTPEQRTAQANAAAAAVTDTKLDTKKRIKDLNKKSGGGGGGTKKTKEEEWVENQQGRIDTYRSLAEQSVVSGTRAAEVIGSIVEAAEKRLTTVRSLLERFDKQMAGGNLTKKEQEQVNALLKEQEGLLKMIEGKYADIGAKMIMEGNYSEGFGLVLKQWSQEIGSLDQMLSKGLLNSMNTLHSSISDLFTSVTDGSKSGKEAMRDFALSMAQAVQRMIAEMLALKLIQTALGWLDPSNQWGLLPTTGKRMGGEVKAASTGIQQGSFRRFALGGSPNRDSEIIRAQPGEFVLRKSAVDAVGLDNLRQLNALGNRVVSGSPLGEGKQAREGDEPTKGGLGAVTNVYVVSPDRQPELTANDVVVIIGDDIQRGGSIKRLVKSVNMGLI